MTPRAVAFQHGEATVFIAPHRPCPFTRDEARRWLRDVGDVFGMVERLRGRGFSLAVAVDMETRYCTHLRLLAEHGLL